MAGRGGGFSNFLAFFLFVFFVGVDQLRMNV